MSRRGYGVGGTRERDPRRADRAPGGRERHFPAADDDRGAHDDHSGSYVSLRSRALYGGRIASLTSAAPVCSRKSAANRAAAAFSASLSVAGA
jgi:hypothetical protein